MKLFVFAHRGEAQAFIEHFSFLPITFHFDGVYQNENDYLLLCGEGPQNASEKTVSVLSAFASQISQVINIGIAGSLTPKLKVGDHAWIRTVLAHNSEKCEFKTYTSSVHDGIDCLTSFSRATNLEQKKELSPFADMVDREAWSIASAAALFKKEFRSLKLISDEVTDVDMCTFIKMDANALSKKMLHHFLEKEPSKKNVAVTPPTHTLTVSDDRFHFTVTQERKLQQLLDGLRIKELITKKDLDYLCSSILSEYPDKNAKDLSRLLLSELDLKLNPLKYKIKEQLEMALLPLTNAGITAHYDPELENPHVTLNTKIKSSKDQKRLQLALDQFNFQKIKDIFEGKIS